MAKTRAINILEEPLGLELAHADLVKDIDGYSYDGNGICVCIQRRAYTVHGYVD